MKRPELTPEEKIDFLERIITKLFGYYGNAKVDWEQDIMAERRKVTFRNVNLQYDSIKLLNSLDGWFDLEIESRAIVEDGSSFIPVEADEDDFQYIHTEEDLMITEDYEQYLLRQTPEKIADIKKSYHPEWTEEDAETREHRYFGKRGGCYHPELLKMKEDPEYLKQTIEEFEQRVADMKENLKKLQEK